MPKKFSPLTLFTYATIVALFFIFIALGFSPQVGASGASFTVFWFYWNVVAQSLKESVLYTLYFLVTLLVFLVGFSTARNFWGVIRRDGKLPTMLGKSSLRDVVREAGRILWRGFLAILPSILFVVLLSLVLSRINEIDKSRLMDMTFAGWEHALTGGYVFAELGAVRYPNWLISFVTLSFDNMTGVVIVTAFILAVIRYETLREMVAAFCFAMLICVPLWIALPALSPQDRFIDNMYKLPVPAQMAEAVARYHPQKGIADFLAMVRTEKNGLGDLPTSTVPSAHLIWAVLAGYYLWKARPWLGWIASPFLLASSFGTVLLAQHYLMDIFLGAMVGIFAIWVTEMVASFVIPDTRFRGCRLIGDPFCAH